MSEMAQSSPQEQRKQVALFSIVRSSKMPLDIVLSGAF